MGRKLTEQEQVDAAAKLLRLLPASRRDDLLKDAGLTEDERAQVSEAVGFEGDL